MSRKFQLVLGLILLGALGLLCIHYLQNSDIAVLSPKGPIAAKERNLIVFTLLLCLIVVIPVFALTIGIAWRYRASNHKARYSPELDHNKWAEFAWWWIPTMLISVLAALAWTSSHSLDPARALASSRPPMTIQVVAMNWKWLFIYPQQNIASVNLAEMPVNTPIDFEITSDAPMNSFWVPQLGGQIYAMAGMTTHLHLEASSIGDFKGSSANISGRGFAGMEFIARAGSQNSFQAWVNNARVSGLSLDTNSYSQLAKPSQNNSVAFYSSVASGLYENIVDKYMMPGMENIVQ